MSFNFNPNKLESINGQRTYSMPKVELLPLTPVALEYLTNVRKLRVETIKAYRLGCNNRGEIVIPFYDENEKFVLAKFRHPEGGKVKRKRLIDHNGNSETYEAKSVIEPNGKPVLFGSHLCDPKEGALVICFGDYDAMTVAQEGVPNCVSLPFGDKGFGFLDTQWDFLQKFSEIVLFTDNDTYPNSEAETKAQKKLDELATRLGKHRVRLVGKEYFHGCKDANELLQIKGESFCRAAVENAEWFPTGIVQVADYQDLDLADGVPFGFPKIDSSTGGACGGHLIIISGDNGAGKTTIALNITANFINEDAPVFWWSGEQKVGKIRYWFERIAAGRNLKRVISHKTGFEYFFPLDGVLEKIKHWYRNYLFQYADVNIGKEQLFTAAETAICRHGCRLIVIDNLMAFTGGEGDGYYQSQGDFAESCKRFAEKWNVPVILITHNKKEDQTTDIAKLPGKNSIEGAKKITNWADTVIQMYRVPPRFREQFENADTLMILCKSRESGTLNIVHLRFEAESAQFSQLDSEEKIYKW